MKMFFSYFGVTLKHFPAENRKLFEKTNENYKRNPQLFEEILKLPNIQEYRQNMDIQLAYLEEKSKEAK